MRRRLRIRRQHSATPAFAQSRAITPTGGGRVVALRLLDWFPTPRGSMEQHSARTGDAHAGGTDAAALRLSLLALLAATRSAHAGARTQHCRYGALLQQRRAPVPDVAVQFTGIGQTTAITDDDGAYVFSDPGQGSCADRALQVRHVQRCASARSTRPGCCSSSSGCASFDDQPDPRLRRHWRRHRQPARRRAHPAARGRRAQPLPGRREPADPTGSSCPCPLRHPTSTSSRRRSRHSAPPAPSSSTRCPRRSRRRISSPCCSATAPATGRCRCHRPPRRRRSPARHLHRHHRHRPSTPTATAIVIPTATATAPPAATATRTATFTRSPDAPARTATNTATRVGDRHADPHRHRDPHAHARRHATFRR